jgi:hypothetical protein
MFHPDREERAMLNVQFDGDVLAVRPDGPITREDVGTLTRTADEYLAGIQRSPA